MFTHEIPSLSATLSTLELGRALFLGRPSAHIQNTKQKIYTFIFLEYALVSLEKVHLSGKHTRPRSVMSH